MDGQGSSRPGRIPSVETRTPPPGGYPSWDDYMADVEAHAAARSGDRFESAVLQSEAQRRADYEANRDLAVRISKAMELAPNIAVFKSLLAGEDVPRSALDQRWAKRYRL